MPKSEAASRIRRGKTQAGFLGTHVKVSFDEYVLRDQPESQMWWMAGGAQARWARRSLHVGGKNLRCRPKARLQLFTGNICGAFEQLFAVFYL